jgi:hypothetical protein
MKIKKALKRLNKVETLLTNIIDQCPTNSRGLRELLDSAKVKKPPARAVEATQSRLSEEGRARISLAAKKRWAELRRKNASAAKTA